MDKIDQKAIIALLIEKMNTGKLWASPFFLQKAVFLLQELYKIPLEFNFYIYKHAPFSNELQDTLNQMRIDDIIKVETNHLKPGNLIINNNGKQILSKLKKGPENEINSVINIMNEYPTSSLDHLTSAIYICTSSIQFGKSKSNMLRHCNPFISKKESIQVLKIAQSLIKSANIQTKNQTL